MDLKKCWWGGGVMPKYFMDLKKCWGVMPKYVMDLKKCWGVEKCLGGMPTNFVYGFEKKIWGGGWLCPNISQT